MRFVTEADAYDPAKAEATCQLVLSMWEDGSGRAEVNGTQLKDFVKFIDNTPRGRKRVIKMLREAAEMLEQGVL
jgi:hypothetical protein